VAEQLGPLGDGSPVAPDGSPVAVYLAMPAEPTFAPVLERLTAGTSVLDLGCGVGRLANVLVDRGHEVTAVDESPAMLAHVDAKVTAVEARLEDLDLGRTFDAVVLASHLVNTTDLVQRAAFLSTVARHLSRDGEGYVQHHDAAGDRYQLGSSSDRFGPLEITTTVHERRGTWVRATTTMTLDGRRWPQHYETELLDGAALSAALADAGLVTIARPTPTWTVAGHTRRG
jgi:SAM-dependent methyltransferase